jgi:AraC-like DNA-binding protein
MLITNGTGTRFIGDSIETFKPYDLVIVGSHLTHVWKNSIDHYEESSELRAEARVILFREDCFGKNFFDLAEMLEIKNLLSRSKRGIEIFGNSKRKIANKILAAYEQNELDRFLSLIQILKDLSQTNEYRVLSSIGYVQQIQSSDLADLNIILDYLIKNFKNNINLQQVASLANMTPTGFCRYFKKSTNKTLIQFVNELRIGYAKSKLIETRENISTICFESGFNNISNFYDHFYKITRKHPSKFRDEHSNKELIIE